MLSACIAPAGDAKFDEGSLPEGELAGRITFGTFVSHPPEGASPLFVALTEQLQHVRSVQDIRNVMCDGTERNHPAVLGCGISGAVADVGNGSVLKIITNPIMIDASHRKSLENQGSVLGALADAGYATSVFLSPVFFIDLPIGFATTAVYMRYEGGVVGDELTEQLAARSGLTHGKVVGLISQHFEDPADVIVNRAMGVTPGPSADNFGDVVAGNYACTDVDAVAAILSTYRDLEMNVNYGRELDDILEPYEDWLPGRLWDLLEERADELLDLSNDELRRLYRRPRVADEDVRALTELAVEYAERELTTPDSALATTLRRHFVIIDPV